MRPVDIICSASGLGAQDQRCSEGPEIFLQAGLIEQVAERIDADLSLHIHRPLAIEDSNLLSQVTQLCAAIAHSVEKSLSCGHFPVVVGGDHSCAVGTWSGVRRAMPTHQNLGLIWVDAHMDSHVPQTSPSGALHGMPLACLLGFGAGNLTKLAGVSPPVKPQHVCLMGVRSYEPEEAALLSRLGVRVIFASEILERGFKAMWQSALQTVSNGTAGFGVSIDLDAVDPRDAPGTGTKVPGGFSGKVLLEALQGLNRDASVMALEIAEFNPYLDQDNKTRKLLLDLICATAAHRA